MKPLIVTLLLLPMFLMSQVDLPDEVRITDEGILRHGGTPVEGFYDLNQVHKLEITLQEPNWFALMDGPGVGGPGGGGDGELLIGVLTVNDTMVLDSVIVGIKGNTSDFRNNSEKKSFKILIDDLKDQDLYGYDNLNLNGAFDDESFMREVLFYDISRGFAPSLKGSFVDLYINGEYWGPYNNIQQLEGRYIKEWFTDNDGTRWRALNSAPTAGGGGPGGDPARFGAGVSTLNYNGPDSTDYNQNYELKSTDKDNPWEDLIATCDPLNNLPIEDLYEALNPVLDIDRTLWVLAQEIVVSDDDGYFFKGGMDYYVYWDKTTGRLMPLEVDGNSIMSPNNVGWSPFYREDDDRFPLINRMLQNTEIRQRYLAHLRTVLKEYFDPTQVHERIDVMAAILDQRIQNDPKKLMTYNEFLNGVVEVKNFVSSRSTNLLNNEEIDRVGVTVTSLTGPTLNGSDIFSDETVTVTAEIEGIAQTVKLYFGHGLDGAYDRVVMVDDGSAGDAVAGDNIYTGTIPAANAGTFVRYYVEAIQDDSFATATYFPSGAEHESYIYQVTPSIVAGEVVINEVMASNSSTAMDGSGAFGDWIELYNKGSEAIDLSDYYLSDDEGELNKWAFPDNTIIAADDYLIVWADSDEEDTIADELHANFKLSASGESVLLINGNSDIVDAIDFGEQQTDISYARIPNGTGSFSFRTATFNMNNDSSLSDTQELSNIVQVKIYPNPSMDNINIEILEGHLQEMVIYDVIGQLQRPAQALNSTVTRVDVSDLESGMYYFQFVAQDGKIITERVSVVK